MADAAAADRGGRGGARGRGRGGRGGHGGRGAARRGAQGGGSHEAGRPSVQFGGDTSRWVWPPLAGGMAPQAGGAAATAVAQSNDAPPATAVLEPIPTRNQASDSAGPSQPSCHAGCFDPRCKKTHPDDRISHHSYHLSDNRLRTNDEDKWKAAGVFAVRTRESRAEVLMALEKKREGDVLSFLGGKRHMRSESNPVDTAVREFLEETNMPDNNLEAAVLISKAVTDAKTALFLPNSKYVLFFAACPPEMSDLDVQFPNREWRKGVEATSLHWVPVQSLLEKSPQIEGRNLNFAPVVRAFKSERVFAAAVRNFAHFVLAAAR